MKMAIKRASAALVLAMASITATAGPNLVVNGGFESGIAGWSTGEMGLGGAAFRHSGFAAASGSCKGHQCVDTLGAGMYIAQTIATEVGASYDLSLWVLETDGPIGEFSVFWDGLMVANVLNPASNATTTGYVEYVIHNLTASGVATAFEIHGRQDNGGIYFDDVSIVQAIGEVPEPGSVVLFGIGAAVLLMTRRRV